MASDLGESRFEGAAARQPLARPKRQHEDVGRRSSIVPSRDRLALGRPIPTSVAGARANDVTPLARRALEAAERIDREAAEAEAGGTLARGFDAALDVVTHHERDLEAARRAAIQALQRDPAHAQEQVRAFEAAAGHLRESDKFWSSMVADTAAGLAVLGGAALMATGIGVAGGALLSAEGVGALIGAAAAGGAIDVGVHEEIDNQFDLDREGWLDFATGAFAGASSLVMPGASAAIGRGLVGAGLPVGVARTLGVALVGSGIGSGTNSSQALVQEAHGGFKPGWKARILKQAALGAAGGAVGGALAGCVTLPIASGSWLGAPVQGAVGGAVSGAGAGAIGIVIEGRRLDWQTLKTQILAGSLAGLAYGAVGQAALQAGLSRQYGDLVRNMGAVDAKVSPILSELSAIQDRLATPDLSASERPVLEARSHALVEQYARHAGQIDALRTRARQLLEAWQPSKAGIARHELGVANPAAAWDSGLSPAQEAAERELIAKFGNVVSRRALMALSEPMRAFDASVDPVGAANIDHLSSVFAGVLQSRLAVLGRPLTQGEVDDLAIETVLTDAWMKNGDAAAWSEARTAPTNLGDRAGTIAQGLRQRALELVGPIKDPQIADVVRGWIQAGQVPMAPAAVAKAAELASLSPSQAAELRTIWADRVMGTGAWQIAQGFLLGTWLHGIPSFDHVAGVVGSAGGDLGRAQAVYEAVLAHHMAGFVANGHSLGGLAVDFASMEKAGELPGGAAERLSNLYEAAIALSGRWRPIIDQAARAGRPLDPVQRAAYRRDAEALRWAIGRLPEGDRSQLLNDDSQQFTAIGMPKWIAMFKGMSAPDITNGALIRRIYAEPVGAYHEENLARGSGEAFERGVAPVARNLGVTLDNGFYRPASPSEPAYEVFARSILADPVLGPEYRAGHPGGARPSAQAVVEWFDGRPADVAALARLAAAAGS